MLTLQISWTSHVKKQTVSDRAGTSGGLIKVILERQLGFFWDILRADKSLTGFPLKLNNKIPQLSLTVFDIIP